MSDYTYRPYPRRLYMGGIVLDNDPHATNSVVVEDAEGEEDARAKGYRKAYEAAPVEGGNGGSQTAPEDSADVATSAPLTPNQGAAADASPDPADDDNAPDDIGSDVDDIEALRLRLVAAGVKVDKRWKEGRLREELAKVAQ